MKNLYALTIGALFGVAPQVHLNTFDSNSSHIMESTTPGTAFNNSAMAFLTSSIINNLATTSQSTEQGIITHVAVEIAQSSGVSASNQTSVQVDSVPPRITIDTIIASIRPQEITQASDTTMTTDSPVTIRYTETSSQAVQTSAD
ncbi:hypothetical protein GGS26DRAFT_540302 [Hypomontagnella submonticulosa]|nr:hypothetical protein GGS26DRAFT_540302 [Hypomontagnella submonticulosa]